MRSLAFLFVLCISCHGIRGEEVSPRVFEDAIIATVECIREVLNVGMPNHGVPTFNPLELDYGAVDFGVLHVNGLRGFLDVKDLLLVGFTDFITSNVHGTINLVPLSYRVQLRLTFPLIKFNTKYSGEFVFTPASISVYGTGKLNLEAVNLVIDLDVTATILGGIRVSNFEFWPRLQGLNSFLITGIYDNEAYSAYVTELILANPSGIVAQYASRVNDIVSHIVTDFINNGGLERNGFLRDIISLCVGL